MISQPGRPQSKYYISICSVLLLTSILSTLILLICYFMMSLGQHKRGMKEKEDEKVAESAQRLMPVAREEVEAQ